MKKSEDILNPDQMTANEFRVAVMRMKLNDFQNLDPKIQEAIIKRAKNANIPLDFLTGTETSQKISSNNNSSKIPLSNISLNEKNENRPQSIEKMLKEYISRYEYLNKMAPLWVQKIDDLMNQSSKLLTLVAKASTEINNEINESPYGDKDEKNDMKLYKDIDENIKQEFVQATDLLKMVNDSLPGKPEYGIPDLSLTNTHNNIGILFSRAHAYYIFTLARYKDTALKLNTNIKIMYQELNQFKDEYVKAVETKNPEGLQILEKEISLKLEATNKEPIFKVLNTK